MTGFGTGNIGQRDVLGRPPQAVIGGLVNADLQNDIITLLNKDAQAKQVSTITVGGATNAKAYIVVVDGTSVTYTSDATATIAEIADGLAAAINASPLAYASCSASSDGVSVVTCTGQTPGVSFTLTESDAQLTVATPTAAATADAVAFGRLMISNGYDTERPNEASELGIKAASTKFTAQVMTLDYTYNNTSISGVTIIDKHTGQIIASAQVTQGVAKDNTTTALANALNAQLPANSVLAANAGGAGGANYELTLTAEVAGLEFDAYWMEDTPATTLGSETYTTGPSVSTSLLRAARGVSLHDDGVENTSVGSTSAQFPANDIVSALRRGEVFVENSQTIVNGSRVYVELGVAADNGKFFNTNSATRLALPLSMAYWKRGAINTTVDPVAHLAIDCQP